MVRRVLWIFTASRTTTRGLPEIYVQEGWLSSFNFHVYQTLDLSGLGEIISLDKLESALRPFSLVYGRMPYRGWFIQLQLTVSQISGRRDFSNRSLYQHYCACCVLTIIVQPTVCKLTSH